MNYTLISLRVLKEYMRDISTTVAIGWKFSSTLKEILKHFEDGNTEYGLVLIILHQDSLILYSADNIEVIMDGYNLFYDETVIDHKDYVSPQDFLEYLQETYPITNGIKDVLKNLNDELDEIEKEIFGGQVNKYIKEE